MLFRTGHRYNFSGNQGKTEVNVLDLSHPIITVTTVGGFIQAEGIAITPDGTMALVADKYASAVAVLSLIPSPVIVDWVTPGELTDGALLPKGVAITPDGTTALIANFDTEYFQIAVLNISATVTYAYSVTILPSQNAEPVDIAVTPDGTKALVVDRLGHVAVLDLTASPIALIQSISVGGEPHYVAITPDGTMALVTSEVGQRVNVLDLTKSPIPLGYFVPTGGNCAGIAITPDGKRAYIANIEATAVDVFDLTKMPIAFLNEIAIGHEAINLVITPDQAPTSVFTASVNDLTASFDGSGSSSPIGTVVQYQWDFGDETPLVTTTSPTTSHTYGSSGTYIASLTVVNSGGTSTEVTFTGKTISNRGLPKARSTQTLQLFDGVASFRGKVYRKKGRVFLKTWWSKSLTPSAKKFQIFARNRRVATIKIHKRKKTLQLHPRKFPQHIAKKYISYLNRKYYIRVVDSFECSSLPTHICVEKSL